MLGDGGMQRRGGAVSRSAVLDIAWKAPAAESDCSGMATMASQPRPATITPPPYFYLKYIKIVSIDELLRPWHN